jgi:hypothetical protein
MKQMQAVFRISHWNLKKTIHVKLRKEVLLVCFVRLTTCPQSAVQLSPRHSLLGATAGSDSSCGMPFWLRNNDVKYDRLFLSKSMFCFSSKKYSQM